MFPEVIPAIYSSTESREGFFLKKFFIYVFMMGGCSTPSFTTNAVSGFSWHLGGHSPVVALISFLTVNCRDYENYSTVPVMKRFTRGLFGELVMRVRV